MTKECTWDDCPILELIHRIGIEAFSEGVRKERERSAGLLHDGACMVLFAQSQFHGSDSARREEEKDQGEACP
ncbi:hypothetical protein KKH23_08970 [Patescibacteria group bacterium]|uniref:Uncharacterized protein n=1 Tax=viral metagenome TaxID=1070528 RepID=A0A6M3MFT4_9ZZZZ|nr:hypothetical protein [Patescibacteria group bacterium]